MVNSRHCDDVKVCGFMRFMGLIFISISEGDGQRKAKRYNSFVRDFKKKTYKSFFKIGGHISGAPSVSTIGMFSVAPSCQP